MEKKMDEKLQKYAEILKDSKVFCGTDEGTRWINKQMMFLVLADEKKIADVHGCHMEKIADNEFGGTFESKPDNENEMKDLFEKLGLKYREIMKDKYCVSYYVTKDEKILVDYDEDESMNKYIEYRCYPESAVKAWDKHCHADHGICDEPNDECPSLSHKEQEEILKNEVEDEGLRWFVHYRLSKANYKEELKVFAKWWDLLKKYGLAN